MPTVGASWVVENRFVGGRCRNCADSSTVRARRGGTPIGVPLEGGEDSSAIVVVGWGGKDAGNEDFGGSLGGLAR